MQTVWLPILKVPAEQRTGGLEMTAQNDPEGHGVQEAAPDVEYMPDGHGIGTLVAFDGKY